MNREEHLEFSKKRALAYLPNAPKEALKSIWSDLRKHPNTREHGAIQLGAMLALGGHLKTEKDVREYIEGIN